MRSFSFFPIREPNDDQQFNFMQPLQIKQKNTDNRKYLEQILITLNFNYYTTKFHWGISRFRLGDRVIFLLPGVRKSWLFLKN